MSETVETNIYIATLPRSGSTLLGMILGSHPEIFHMGESSYWGKLNPNDIVCSCGRKGCSVLLEVNSQVASNDDVKSIYQACSMIDRVEEPNKQYHSLSLPDDSQKQDFSLDDLEGFLLASCLGLEKLSRTFRQVTGKRVMVDNTKAIRMAEKLLGRPSWKIILLLRDPRGMAFSNKKSGERKGVSRPISSKIPVYKDFAKRAIKLLNEQSPILYLRYEEICQDPSASIKKVCAFIEVGYADSMLKFKEDRGHTLMGNRMRLDNNQVIKEDLEWKTGLTREEKLALSEDRELVSLFGNLGYKICG